MSLRGTIRDILSGTYRKRWREAMAELEKQRREHEEKLQLAKEQSMTLDVLEKAITAYMAQGAAKELLLSSRGKDLDAHRLYVIKYTAPKFLGDILSTRSLYAA